MCSTVVIKIIIQQAIDVRALPNPKTPTAPRFKAPRTTRDDRIAIQTALKFGILYANITTTLNVTKQQIAYTKAYPTTPQYSKSGRKPLIRTPQRTELER